MAPLRDPLKSTRIQTATDYNLSHSMLPEKNRIESLRRCGNPCVPMQQQAIQLAKISIYGGTQTRAATNDEAVSHYAEEMESGVEFPPITLFFDGATYWLADGFHRYLAAKRNEYEEISSEVHEGGRADALLCALGANATNGVFRTTADKRHAVEVALEEWPDRSNPALAEICKVSVEFVRKQRQKSPLPGPESVTGRDGKKYPARIERQPRGGGGSDDSSEKGESSGGGGKPSKKNAAAEMAFGGSSKDLEMEALAMERHGETSFMRPGDPMPSSGSGLARMAIAALARISENDPEREEAFRSVFEWLSARMGGMGEEKAESQPGVSGE